MMKHPAQPPETTSETTVYPAKDKKQVQEGLTERPELDNGSAQAEEASPAGTMAKAIPPVWLQAGQMSASARNTDVRECA